MNIFPRAPRRALSPIVIAAVHSLPALAEDVVKACSDLELISSFAIGSLFERLSGEVHNG